MIDNQDIAVLTRVNDLAERYGVKPYDFVATVGHNDKNEYHLAYETKPDNPLVKVQFDKMLASLGPKIAETGELVADPKDIIKTLDEALRRSGPLLSPWKH